MNNSYSKIEDYHNEICNAIGCLNKADDKIVLPIGCKSVKLLFVKSVNQNLYKLNLISYVQDIINTKYVIMIIPMTMTCN